MPDSDRHPYRAAARSGLITLGILCLLAIDPARGQQSRPNNQAKAANENPSNSQITTVVIPFSPSAAPYGYGAGSVDDDRKGPSPGEWGLIVVGLIQAGVLGWQIWFLGRTLNHERSRSEKELRAYLFVYQAKHKHFISIISPNLNVVRARFEFGNSGKTPAKNVKIAARARQMKSGTVIDLTDLPELKAMGPLGPNDERTRDVEIDVAFTGDRDETETHLWGRIEYDDEFAKGRWTTFHVYIGGEVSWRGRRFHTHKDGNDFR